MFSKLRKSRSEKPTQPPKLRGMPALKQMRSSKREETLKNGSVLASLSELEKQAIVTGKEAIHPTIEEVERQKSQHVSITPNYKRSTSPDSGHHSSGSRQANHVDRIACANGSTFLFYGDTSPGITEDIPEASEDLDDETTSVNSPWRISKGDSGYKSKDDEKADSKNKKHKRSRKKSNGRPNNCGLHQVKQQRKASREGVSMSMRALTPKERESIQCLEDVLKDHPHGDESSDEVFHSESDIENEAEMIFSEAKERVETIDHGYASVNDISRRYSVESAESVGSIIDLVGNLPTSPSSQTSPRYSAVEASKKSDDVIELPSDDVISDKFSNANSHDEGIQQDPPPLSSDVIGLSDEAISQLDDVINSFNFESDQEGNQDGHRDDTIKASHIESADFVAKQEMEMIKREKQESVDAVEERVKEKSDSRERKKKKKTKRHKSRDSASDDEKEKKRRERRKERDSETEKERKERKKQRKEEKRKKRREISESEDEARRREEHIARHVDKISTLTQNMIITAQKNIEAEPIYAQVKKPKKKKDINGNLKFDDISPLEEVVPDPPSPFANPTAEEIESERQRILSQSPEKQDHLAKFHLTSTPVSSKPKRERAYTSMQDEIIKETHILPEPKRPVSDSSQYANIMQPYLSGSNPQMSGRLYVSPSMLADSSQNLKHISSPGPKVLQIDPFRNSVKETIFETTAPPSAFRDQPISRVDPKRSSDPSKNEKVQRRPPRVRHNFHPGRPVSLNLEDNPKIGFLGEAQRAAATKHSSFREEKSHGDQGQKSRPFVIRTTKKPIQLC